MTSKIRSRQERINVHVARVLSELGLSTRAETWFLDGHRAPDFIIMHPLVQEILGEAEVGDIDSVCDEAIIDKPKIREKVAERFADPRLAGYNFILLLTYRRKDLEELAELDDSKVAERVKTLKVCVGLATRAEAYELREHYIHVYREPVEITSIPSVLNILINEFFQKTFKKTLSIKEAEQFVDRLISLIDHASSGLAREIMESKEKEKLLEDLKGVASKLSIAWDSIKDPLERIKLTYKTILLVEALGMMLYKIVSKKLFLKPLDCQRLSHEVLIEYLEGLLDRGKYNELNSSFLELLKSIPSHELLDDGLQKICREIVQETPQ
jgi:ribosomal protein L17